MSKQAPEEMLPYRLNPRPLRALPDVDLDRSLALSSELEDAETLHNLSLPRIDPLS
jgi:hypothetical protein